MTQDCCVAASHHLLAGDMSGEASASASHHECRHGGRMSEGDMITFPSGSMADFWFRTRTLTKLHCLNGGYHLRIMPDGSISGSLDENDPHVVLKLQATEKSVVVVKSAHMERYLAMNNKGHLYGSETVNDDCHFVETLEENKYNTYKSKKHNMYVALKKNGTPKPGSDADLSQQAVFFLPRSADRRDGEAKSLDLAHFSLSH
ncbi:fibroblast growth factor 1-like isoform X1 [Stigmatopora argus]